MTTKPQKVNESINTEIDVGQGIKLDLTRLIDTRMLIQANSGGGKSWLLRLIAEQSADKVQTIILDREGEYATLRERLDLVLVGREGEIATDVRSASLLARKLMEVQVSAVVDLYDLDVDERREYVQQFLESLLALPRTFWHPTLIVIDEAHDFAPESGKAVSTGAVISLMSQGRKRGYAGLLATQRLSKLHKDAAAESNNVAIGRTWLDIDQQRAGDLLGMNKADRQQLRDLSSGEFFAFGPAFSHTGVSKFRANSVTTTHPTAGARHTMRAPQPSTAIQQIAAQFEGLPEQAEEETRTLEEAHQRIAELEGKLSSRKPEEKITNVRTLTEEDLSAIRKIEQSLELASNDVRADVFGNIERLKDMTALYEKLYDELLARHQEVKEQLAQIARRFSQARSASPPRLANSPLSTQSTTPLPQIKEYGSRQATNTAGGLTRPQQRILDALASFEALGIGSVNQSNLAIYSDQSPKSSGYRNNLSALRSAGLIASGAEKTIFLTERGREQAEWNAPPASLETLHSAWFSKLPNPQARILRVLIENYPKAVERAECAELSEQSPTSSGYRNNLSALRSLGLIDYRTSGYVIALPVLFPDGLR